MESMYETLMRLPLFAGVSHKKISETVGKNKFHFLKYAPGDVIAKEGEMCTHMKSVITGSVQVTTESHDRKFSVTQILDAPDLIAPDYFFGKKTVYPATVKAVDNVGILQIDKSDFLNIIKSDQIFLFNYLNILSMNAQLAVDGVLSLTSGSIERRIAYWIIALTQSNARSITLQCRQRDMYTVFGVPRQSLIAALDNLVARNIITYSPREITVLDRRTLASLLQ